MTLPRIGITLGDPGGIGPEVTLKSLSQREASSPAHFILFGSRPLTEETLKTLGLHMDIPSLTGLESSSLPSICLWDIKTPLHMEKKGVVSKENGEASFQYFQRAVKKARDGALDAVVTAPISKHSWALAGIPYPGHTEYLSHAYPQAIMAFWSAKIKVALFTHHISLKEAIKKIKTKALFKFFQLLNNSLIQTGKTNMSFLVSGLNPHAGEEGLLGLEEKEEIAPAVQKAQEGGISIQGPYPPDVVFRKAYDLPDTMVIALYHDQGLIAFKMAAFDEGVNMTLGLPFIRTSPDHGTAFDIAGKGRANPKSMTEAIKLALDLSSSRTNKKDR
ncbi:MAG: 4-hydroxythreonine-4-phosphate dehydrogenase PdxA [Candidatus Aminicenantes bacterium]